MLNSRIARFATKSTPKTKLFINGEFFDSTTTKWIQLRNPATQELVSLVPETTQQELDYASKTAAEAFKTWRKSSVLTRQKVMIDLAANIRANMDALAESITLEQVTLSNS